MEIENPSCDLNFVFPQLPKVFTKVAYEVELGVVIGKPCKNVSKADAMSYVAGYCLALDLTAQCNLVRRWMHSIKSHCCNQ